MTGMIRPVEFHCPQCGWTAQISEMSKDDLEQFIGFHNCPQDNIFLEPIDSELNRMFDVFRDCDIWAEDFLWCYTPTGNIKVVFYRFPDDWKGFISKMESKRFGVSSTFDSDTYIIHLPMPRRSAKQIVWSGNAKSKDGNEKDGKKKRRKLTMAEKRDLRDTAALGVSFAGLGVSIASLALTMNRKARK
ncbi:MAG: hypothetical protein IJV02_04060 [Candidatus Methanomethylophilaceae archaeon]|nr:hypothetical protein [Candidatus Methanomethylophilaceae archaeon]